MLSVFLISLVVYTINIPFGYWRSNVRTYSLQWFFALHIPVPIIIALRIASGIGFAWYTYVFLVTAFFLGQRTGSFIINRIKRICEETSSCLVMDVFRCMKSQAWKGWGTTLCNKRIGFSHLSGTTGSTNAVNETIIGQWHLIIYHMSYIWDV